LLLTYHIQGCSPSSRARGRAATLPIRQSRSCRSRCSGANSSLTGCPQNPPAALLRPQAQQLQQPTTETYKATTAPSRARSRSNELALLMLFLLFILIIVISLIISILIVTAVTACVTGAAAGRAANGNAEASTAAESQRSSLARRPYQPLKHRTATAVDASNPHPPETPSCRHQAAAAPSGPPEPPAEAVAALQRYGRRHSSCIVRRSRRSLPPNRHRTTKATRAAAAGTRCTCPCPCRGRRQRPPTAYSGAARARSHLS
jgi:hypothetical protein